MRQYPNAMASARDLREAAPVGFAQELGARLSAARMSANMTQRDVAVRSGVGENSVSYYETGSKTPRPETIVKLASALGVSVQWLMTGHEATVVRASESPSLRAFLSTPLGKTVTERERAELGSIEIVDGVPMDELYQMMLAGLRGMVRRDE